MDPGCHQQEALKGQRTNSVCPPDSRVDYRRGGGPIERVGEAEAGAQAWHRGQSQRGLQQAQDQEEEINK